MSYREPPTSWPRRCRPRQRGGGLHRQCCAGPLSTATSCQSGGLRRPSCRLSPWRSGCGQASLHCPLRPPPQRERRGGRWIGPRARAPAGGGPADLGRRRRRGGAAAPGRWPTPRCSAAGGGHRSAQQSRSLRPRVARKKFSGLLIADLGRSTVMLLSPAPACPSHDSIRNLELGSSWGRSRVDLGLIWVDLG